MSVGRILIVAILLAAAAPAPAQELLDQLAGLVKRGKLNVEVDLQAGHVPAGPAWTLQVIGSPKAKLVAEADEGRVDCVDIDVTGGELLVNGRGLRPRLSIEGMRFEQGKGITEARFRGRGIWRPIVAIFRTLARPALRRLDVPTDIGSILRGEIVSSEKSASAPNTEFLELVREVHINDTEFEAFAGYPLELSGLVELETAAHSSDGKPVRAAIAKGTFRPARRAQPAQFEVDGRIDGEIPL